MPNPKSMREFSDRFKRLCKQYDIDVAILTHAWPKQGMGPQTTHAVRLNIVSKDDNKRTTLDAAADLVAWTAEKVIEQIVDTIADEHGTEEVKPS